MLAFAARYGIIASCKSEGRGKISGLSGWQLITMLADAAPMKMAYRWKFTIKAMNDAQRIQRK